MSSAGRHSELQPFVFDLKYIQFKPKGAGVTLYFSPELMRKNQRPNQVNDPWYIPAVPLASQILVLLTAQQERSGTTIDTRPRVEEGQTLLFYFY